MHWRTVVGQIAPLGVVPVDGRLHRVAMSYPTGPRGVGDADDPDTPRDDGAAHAGREQEWAMGETLWATPEENEPARGRAIPAFVSGALAGILVLGLIWAATSVLRDTGTATRPAATTPVASNAAAAAEPTWQAEALRPPSRTDRCRQADTDLAVPLRAAAPALDQWEVHVGAMNKLVVGAITPQQASAFWSQTRAGAERNLARFDSASRRVRLAGVDCLPPSTLSHAPGALRACAQHIVREQRTLEAARTALQTWRTHIRDMKMLDMGHLSPAVATRLWLANWHRGVRELRTYRTATRAMDGLATC